MKNQNTKNVPEVLKPAIFQCYMYITIDCHMMKMQDAWTSLRARDNSWILNTYKLIHQLTSKITEILIVFSNSSSFEEDEYYDIISVPLVRKNYLSKERLESLIDCYVSANIGIITNAIMIDLIRLYTVKDYKSENTSDIEKLINSGSNPFSSKTRLDLLTYKPEFLSNSKWQKQINYVNAFINSINNENLIMNLISEVLAYRIGKTNDLFKLVKDSEFYRDVIDYFKLTNYIDILETICNLTSPISPKMTKKRYIFKITPFAETVLMLYEKAYGNN